MASEDPLVPKVGPLRIVLVGMVQVGKTKVKNAILRCSEENEKPASPSSPGTGKYRKEEVKIRGQNVVVVNTPGLRDPETNDEEVVKKIKECVLLARPGPHVFLFVLRVEAFTEDGKETVKIMKETFGNNVLKHTMVLFTNGEELEESGKTIQQFIDEYNDLKSFVNQCKDRWHVFVNTDQSPSQVTKLLQQIYTMVDENKGQYYIDEKALRKRIALAVKGSALAGAGVGGVASHFVGSALEIPAGATVGAAVGGILGFIGIVAVERIKAWLGRGGCGGR